MDIRKLLVKSNLSQRELGRRLGYGSNGVISGVLTGRINIPAADVPRWAEALNLEGDEKRQFIDAYGAKCIPAWCWDRLKKAELEADDLRSENKKLRSQIADYKLKISPAKLRRKK